MLRQGAGQEAALTTRAQKPRNQCGAAPARGRTQEGRLESTTAYPVALWPPCSNVAWLHAGRREWSGHDDETVQIL